MTNETLLTGGRFVSLLGPPIWIKNNVSKANAEKKPPKNLVK